MTGIIALILSLVVYASLASAFAYFVYDSWKNRYEKINPYIGSTYIENFIDRK